MDLQIEIKSYIKMEWLCRHCFHMVHLVGGWKNEVMEFYINHNHIPALFITQMLPMLSKLKFSEEIVGLRWPSGLRRQFLDRGWGRSWVRIPVMPKLIITFFCGCKQKERHFFYGKRGDCKQGEIRINLLRVCGAIYQYY